MRSTPDPRIVHPLPRAPQFVGRVRELDELGAAWSGGDGGVVALVGLGGAGKTALAARFLAGLLRPAAGLAPLPSDPAGPPPGGVFVWSFYRQPDAGVFLREAFHYFAADAAAGTPARGAGLLHLLREALAGGAPHLLVLDGLERVQEAGSGPDGAGYGRVEDPLLRGLLTRIAEGAGRAAALVTSRFPLTDLEPYRGRGYRPIDVGGLDRGAALDLLRRRGVVGDDDTLGALVDAYGAHALTLDHLGGLIGQFLGGDPSRAPEAPALAAADGDRQALRLARLLRAYEDHLPPAELALLERLCLLRGGVHEDQLVRLFGCAPAVHARAARAAAALVGRLKEPPRFPGERPLGLAAPTLAAVEEALCAAPLAGPADDFPREVAAAVAEVLDGPEPTGEDLEALLRLYDHAAADPPTDRRPLPADDRAAVASLARAYRTLQEHLLGPPAPVHHDALKAAFKHLGWGAPPLPKSVHPEVARLFDAEAAESGRGPEDLTPQDVDERLRRVVRRLRRAARKHAALVRVREVCRLRRRKWELAGPLAALDAGDVRRAVAALEGRHLLVRESDGSVGAHPAVRDHFARRGESAGGWHDLIREQLVSLVRRPGRGLPEDKATLDLVEEAIHHALEAGRTDEARAVYERGLGGLRHLGWKLGEMARGLRVLKGFPECPDPSGLGWFLRALGELDEAHRVHAMPYFRADVRLLQGRLPEAAAAGDSVRAATAAFLMGEATAPLPPDLLGLAVPRVLLLLFLGRLHQAWREPRHEELYAGIGWEGDRARHQLLMAEVARRQADADGCRRFLDAATGWVLRSGSVEHLGLWHLVRARAARDAGDLKGALRAADEGVHTARQCGLGLFHVLLLNARAEIALPSDPASAASSAREALALASADGCRFRWGEAESGHLLGQALAAQWRFTEARAALRPALSLRLHLGDPAAPQTEALLARLPS